MSDNDAILGASRGSRPMLWAGWVFTAMASHLRAGSPVFSHLLFGLYLGLFLWAGLWLRDVRLRALFPFRS